MILLMYCCFAFAVTLRENLLQPCKRTKLNLNLPHTELTNEAEVHSEMPEQLQTRLNDNLLLINKHPVEVSDKTIQSGALKTATPSTDTKSKSIKHRTVWARISTPSPRRKCTLLSSSQLVTYKINVII